MIFTADVMLIVPSGRARCIPITAQRSPFLHAVEQGPLKLQLMNSSEGGFLLYCPWKNFLPDSNKLNYNILIPSENKGTH